MAVALSVPAARPRRVIDLEDLVGWAIRDQKADRDNATLHAVEMAAQVAIGRQRHPVGGCDVPAGWGVDSCIRVAEICTVGMRIGGGQIRGVAPRLHPDAEAVMAAINRMTNKRLRRLVLHHARMGGRPTWNLGPQRFKPVENDNPQGGGRRHKVIGVWEDTPSRSQIARLMMARGLRIVDEKGRPRIPATERGFTYRTLNDGRRQVAVRHCPVQLVPSDADVQEAREEYAAWHAGMMAVLGELIGVPLRDHQLQGFAAPAVPWA